jgi:hypothetical protein
LTIRDFAPESREVAHMAQKPLAAGRIGKSPLVAVRMPPTDRDRLVRASKAHGLTLSEYMRRAIDAALDAEDTGDSHQAVA